MKKVMKEALRFLFNVFDGNDKETLKIFNLMGDPDKDAIIKYLDAVQRYAGKLINKLEQKELSWE